MAKRFSKFLTAVGLLENFWSKASDKLWAGSVEISKTYIRENREIWLGFAEIKHALRVLLSLGGAECATYTFTMLGHFDCDGR